jgi:hypothetical protein
MAAGEVGARRVFRGSDLHLRKAAIPILALRDGPDCLWWAARGDVTLSV